MEDKLLRDLRREALCLLGLLEVSMPSSAIAYDAGCGWRVRVVPMSNVKINISRYGRSDDGIYIAFPPFEEEMEIRDFILPLLETETYRERQDQDLCSGESAGGVFHLRAIELEG